MEDMRQNNILLIRPAYSLSIYKVYGRLPKYREIRPPLGLMYIASYLEEKGFQVKIIDAEVGLLSNEALLSEILRINPEYVGITSTTPESPKVENLFAIIKRAAPGITTIAGGPHSSAVPITENGTYDAIDYIVFGEGEKALLKIIKERPKEKIIEVENAAPLDELPFPARHKVDYEHYRFPVPGRGMLRMDTVLTSRGCPFQCSFCFNRNTQVRFREINNCLEEIEFSHKTYNTKFFMFLDDTLTVSKERVLALCNGIIRRGLQKKIVFYANTRADTIDFETLKIMKRAGLVEMSMGVESGNQSILNSEHKGTKIGQYVQVYSWMRKLGLETRGSFIIGHPYETHQTIRDTINFAKKLKLMRVSCCILTPYPGTQVYKKALKNDGIHLVSDKWEEFTRYGRSVIRTDELTKEDLENYQKIFFMEFYTQPKVLWYHFLQLFKGNLSLYYYRPVFFALKTQVRNFFKKQFRRKG